MGRRLVLKRLRASLHRHVQALRLVLEAEGVPEWQGLRSLPFLPGGCIEGAPEDKGGCAAHGYVGAEADRPGRPASPPRPLALRDGLLERRARQVAGEVASCRLAFDRADILIAPGILALAATMRRADILSKYRLKRRRSSGSLVPTKELGAFCSGVHSMRASDELGTSLSVTHHRSLNVFEPHAGLTNPSSSVPPIFHSI
mmetsp:Transcript_83189/g.239108  ORF Transcript_83189/g.239108 Transcript_83189/m.239108 type:complete len:201 (-) Transcript_83189:99-701(-)